MFLCMVFDKGNLSTSTAVLAGAGLISLSILISGGVIKIKGAGLGKTTTTAQVTPAPAENTAPAPAAPPPTESGKASVDDDPILGDKNAPVTLIEFSDYECPFCKRHFDQTYSQLKKDYIDTGKVKLVFRDLPLSFHDPMATTEAMAANCAREQGGDNAYFKYHDEIFKKTTSNGSGLTKEALYTMAADIGLNSGNFKSCLDGEKYKDEVKKDLADATTAGASGTPTFFVGKTSADGTIDGTKIVGAQPFPSFQTAIDALLK